MAEVSWQTAMDPDRERPAMEYAINYGFGWATLVTPLPNPEERFMTLASTCFGLRKSITDVKILGGHVVRAKYYEMLSFGGDVYAWREDGARMMLAPEEFKDDDWDTYYCDICRAKTEDISITVEAYIDECRRTDPTQGDVFEHRLVHYALGIAGEAGECADMVKKNIFQKHSFDRDHFVKELGDVLWYLTMAADLVGCSLEDVMTTNVRKLRERYPNGFEAEKSIHRKEGDV